LSLPERIAHYERSLHKRIDDHTRDCIDLFSQSARHYARELEAGDPRPVLCHNDLLPPNLVRSGGRLWALDWEYAAVGSRWFDLAVVCAGENLDVQAGSALAGRYLGRPPTPAESRLLQYARLSYAYLELLWYLANTEGYDPETALEQLHSLAVDPS